MGIAAFARIAVATLLAAPLWSAAQPALPPGLEDSGPPLPAGIGKPAQALEEDEDDTWAFEEADPSNPLAGLTGFWEVRAGHRLQSADNQRQASLAESRLQLEKNWAGTVWSAGITADLVYDAVEESRRIDLETGQGWLDLREAWVQWRFGGAGDLKAGRQVLTWGVGDLVFINDLFPKDWNSFLAGRDEQYLKAPSDALRLGAYTDIVNINLIYTPEFDPDRYIDGRRLSYYSPLAGAVVGQNRVLDGLAPNDEEWALRLYRSLGRYEVALYGYDGFWKSPGGFDPATGRAVFPPLRVYGGSVRGPLGPGIVSVEAGYYDSRADGDGSDPFVNNDEWRFLAGYEWEAARNTTLGFQYYLEAMEDYDRYRRSLPTALPAREEYRQVVTMRATRKALRQTLTWSLFAFYSPSDDDYYLRPNVHYKVTDNLALSAGFNLFGGRETWTFFGQFEDNSNVYAAVRYSF